MGGQCEYGGMFSRRETNMITTIRSFDSRGELLRRLASLFKRWIEKSQKYSLTLHLPS